MIEELIKILQERKLSEEKEQELFQEMEQAKEIIAQNTVERQIQQAKQKEVLKDNDRMKLIKLFDEEISDRKKKNRRLEKVWNIFAIILTFIAVGTAMGLAVLAGLSGLPFVIQVLMPVLGVVVPLGISYPLAKILAKKAKINDYEIAKLTKEKELIIDDVKVDLENVVLDNIKLTNLPKIEKHRDTCKEEIVIDENANIIKINLGLTFRDFFIVFLINMGY